jgi:hypothetical protein
MEQNCEGIDMKNIALLLPIVAAIAMFTPTQAFADHDGWREHHHHGYWGNGWGGYGYGYNPYWGPGWGERRMIIRDGYNPYFYDGRRFGYRHEFWR